MERLGEDKINALRGSLRIDASELNMKDRKVSLMSNATIMTSDTPLLKFQSNGKQARLPLISKDQMTSSALSIQK